MGLYLFQDILYHVGTMAHSQTELCADRPGLRNISSRFGFTPRLGGGASGSGGGDKGLL